ncbi:MAG TPA: FGGY-family carbohydrate kinase [Candidatus Bathyarchaeia archaeon]|nr:FGGY-family carbohydrate kinase [Candidatus Bathyarchaeia archaeon]
MADHAPYFAALDYGTGGAKCAIFDAGGRCCAVAREPWTYSHAPFELEGINRGYAFDPQAFWAAMSRCARAALSESGLAPGAVKGIATTAQRLGAVFLDAQGREIYAGPNMDGRGFAGALEIMDKVDMQRAIRISGHWPPFIFSLARLIWFRNDPAHARVAHVLTLNDWLSYRLSGALSSEPSNACESLLLDVSRRDWSREILDLFEVDEHLLPPVVEPGTQIGKVSPEAAEATGFAAGTPVFAGGGDTQCALLGSDVVQVGAAGAVLGTTTPVMVVTQQPEFDLTGKLWTGCHVLPERWTFESNAGDTGIAYEWLVGILGLDGNDSLRRAEELVATLPPEPQSALTFAGPQLFDLVNFNPGRPLAILYRYPLFTERPTRATFLRAFMENVACAIRGNLEQLESARGTPASTLTLSGGMTRSPGLRASFARILRTPLLISEEPNATALGAAVLAASGLGTYDSVATAAAAMVRRHVLEPDTTHSDAYEERYARWRELDATLKGLSL